MDLNNEMMSMRNSNYVSKNVRYYKLKLYTLNIKATTKLITESVLAIKSIKNIYQNYRKYLIKKRKKNR